MNVASILNEKGRDIFSLGVTNKISDVCTLLSQKRIGSVLILKENDQIAGIVSERDIVRALAKEGAGLLEKPVTTIMTKTIICCSERDTIEDVLRQMTKGRFRHLPVVELGTLVGFISIGDVVKHRIAIAELESASMRDYIATG